MRDQARDETMEENLREDVLIARIVDQLDAPEDWRGLDRLAEDDAEVWGRVLTTLRAECHLRTEGASLLAAGAAVELPFGEPTARVSPRRGGGFVRAGRWAAAAAAVLLAFLIGRNVDSESAPTPPAFGPAIDTPELVSSDGGAASPDVSSSGAEALAVEKSLAGAWGTYLAAAQREGVFVREMTPVVLETKPNPDGSGVEVTFLRGVVQRDVVDSVFEVGVDEEGRPMPVPVDSNRYVQLASF